MLRACNERPFDCSADTGRCHRGRAAHWGERRCASLILSLSSGPGPARPAEAGGGTALDLLPCRRLLPHASTCWFIHATQRDSHPSRPLCRLQRSDNSESTMRCEFRHRIAAPAPKQIISRTHRPPTVGQIFAPGPAVHGHTLVPVATLVNGSQPTLKIADKYKSRRFHRDLRTPLWRAENQAALPNCFVIPDGCDASPDAAAQRLGQKCGPRVR